ncbi:uncharacterized protein LOC134178384 [Corticium candelabrum]|uniref:uncharacterized protein LOC134178384 n=1 Tax=Corticium candelabrum TaxID=121492 RepID=UPI002E25D200|nr:uncharacterized protein LOC134178384 [Corticium candelabrum]
MSALYDIKDSLIQDRIVLGVADQRLTTRLLATGHTDLTKALEICRPEEVATAQRQRMVTDSQRGVNVATVHHEVVDEDEDSKEVQVDALRQYSSRGSMIKDCMRCEGTNPPRKCPAWDKRCQNAMGLTIGSQCAGRKG